MIAVLRQAATGTIAQNRSKKSAEQRHPTHRLCTQLEAIRASMGPSVCGCCAFIRSQTLTDSSSGHFTASGKRNRLANSALGKTRREYGVIVEWTCKLGSGDTKLEKGFGTTQFIQAGEGYGRRQGRTFGLIFLFRRSLLAFCWSIYLDTTWPLFSSSGFEFGLANLGAQLLLPLFGLGGHVALFTPGIQRCYIVYLYIGDGRTNDANCHGTLNCSLRSSSTVRSRKDKPSTPILLV